MPDETVAGRKPFPSSGDKDYRELSALLGTPPQVILLTMGNSEKARLLTVLTTRGEQIRELLADAAVGCVEVG